MTLFQSLALIPTNVNLVITWSRNPHTKTPIPEKPSKSGLIGVTFLYLYVNVICYFQVHRGHIRSDLSLAIFCYVIML